MHEQLKSKPSANCACAILLIDGLGWAVCMRLLVKITKVQLKHSANCACMVPLIDGMVHEYAFTRGLHASSSRRV